MKDALILAHGAFHGPWCWDRISKGLEEHGIHCIAVDLNRGGLHADRDELQANVDSAIEEGFRVHAIGHSLGCPSVALIDPNSIASAIFLAGPVEGPGMPAAEDCTVEGFLSKLQPQDDGRALLSREDSREVFYHRCPEAEAEWALDRLRPTFVYGGETTDPPLWDAIPVTYIACSDDRAVRPDYQRAAAARCPFSETIETDHSPMLSRPEELIRHILTALERGA